MSRYLEETKNLKKIVKKNILVKIALFSLALLIITLFIFSTLTIEIVL